MAKKEVLNKLKSTDLEKSLGKTIYNRHKQEMDSFIAKGLKEGDGYFSIPVIQALVNEDGALGKKLIELYDRKIILDGDVKISNEMKILQASLFDGLVVGINTDKNNEMAIYTANTKAIFGVDTDSKFSMDKTVELNTQGILNAVRIDVEYTSEAGFQYKAVNLNKNTNLQVKSLETGEGRFYLVPYIAIQRSLVFFDEFLSDGRTMEVTQEVDGVVKVRNISTRVSDLAKYSDSEDFVKTLKPEYFPLKGFFYAPVLGASSLTTGRTKIRVLDIERVRIVNKPKVEKSDNAYELMVTDFSIHNILNELYHNDEEAYAVLVTKLPRKQEFFGAVNDMPNPIAIMKYSHQLKGAELKKFKSLIPGLETQVDNKKGIINMCERVDINDYTKESLENALKQGVYKFTIRKKDCNYSTMVVTNNTNILKQLYGENYFGMYESLGVRLYKLEELVAKGINIVDALNYCGLDSNDEVLNSIEEIRKKDDPEKSTHERLAGLFKDGDTKGKGVRRSSTGDSILVRKCFAILSGSGATDYYGNLDISKVVDMYRVG